MTPQCDDRLVKQINKERQPSGRSRLVFFVVVNDSRIINEIKVNNRPKLTKNISIPTP